MALTNAQTKLLDAAKQAARELGARGMALTPVIGELSACEKADLVWEPSDGYDARVGDLKVQIKTRKSWSTPEVNPRGRLGRFGRKAGYPFDVALYVELDDRFEVAGIWRIGVSEIRALEEAEKGQKGLHKSTFVAHAERLGF